MVPRCTLGIAFASALTFATPALAQDSFDRLETVGVALNALMNQGFIEDIPQLEGHLPPPEWDDPLREAYRCLYDTYVAEVGQEAVDTMVTDMEQALPTLTPRQVLDGEGAVAQPAGITDDRAGQIVADCRLIDVFFERMTEAGALEILMQDGG